MVSSYVIFILIALSPYINSFQFVWTRFLFMFREPAELQTPMEDSVAPWSVGVQA